MPESATESTTESPAAAASTELVESQTFELDQRRAKAYAESGYWPDAKSVAQALVKVEAGRSLGLAPLIAMSEVHVIDGKPTLGAGALAQLVKVSGRYDYVVVELTDESCVLRFVELRTGAVLGESTFTMDDAARAKLLDRGQAWLKYPRNMLFARAMSNGVAWYCPDVTSGRVYVPDEMGAPIDEVDDEQRAPGAYDEPFVEDVVDVTPEELGALAHEPVDEP
jgi:hypothetical protein